MKSVLSVLAMVAVVIAAGVAGAAYAGGPIRWGVIALLAGIAAMFTLMLMIERRK